MEFFGVKVVSVKVGSRILKDVVNEVFRFWVVNVEDMYYIMGFVFGLYLFLEIVCDY